MAPSDSVAESPPEDLADLPLAQLGRIDVASVSKKPEPLGVNSHIVKPVEFASLVETVAKIGLYWILTSSLCVSRSRRSRRNLVAVQVPQRPGQDPFRFRLQPLLVTAKK